MKKLSEMTTPEVRLLMTGVSGLLDNVIPEDAMYLVFLTDEDRHIHCISNIDYADQADFMLRASEKLRGGDHHRHGDIR